MPEESETIVDRTDPVRAAGQFVTGRFDIWTEAMRPLRDRWTSLKKRHHNYRGDKPTQHAGKTRSNLGIPLPAQTVDTTVARWQADMFRTLPYGRLKPVSPEDDPKADQMQKVIDYQQRITNFVSDAIKTMKDAAWAGVGISKLVFDVREQVLPEPRIFQIPVPAFISESGSVPIQMGTRKVRKKVMETPRLIVDEPFNWFFPPDAPDKEAMEGIIHRTWQTPRGLILAVDGLGRPLYPRELIERVRNAKASVDKDQQAKQADTTRGTGETMEGKHKTDKLELLEYYGCLPEPIANALVEEFYPEDDPHGDWIVTIVYGTNETLRVEPSPHFTKERPYFFCKIDEESGQLTGNGLLEKVEKLGLMIDGLYNNVVDNMNLVNNRPVYINTAAGMKKQQVVFGPGKVWTGRTSPRDAVMVVDVPDISQSVWLLIRLLTGHYKEYTGVTDPVLAQSSSGEQTATEFAGLLASAATRNALHERTIEESFLKPLFRMWVIFNQQYLTDAFYLRMDKGAEYDFLRVKPEDLQGLFDVEFEGSTKQQSAAVLAAQIMQLLQINMTMPVPVNDIPKLVTRLQKDAFEWQDSEQYLNPMFAEQMQIMNALSVMQKLGETKQSLNPAEAAKVPGNTAVKRSASNGKSGGKNAATPHNAPNPLSDADVFRGVEELNNPDILQRQVT